MSRVTRVLVVIGLISSLIAGRAPGVLAQSTTTLTGNVRNAATGEPMPFANVYLNNSTNGTVSDTKGNFVLINVPLGTVELVASFVGFQTTRQPLRLIGNQVTPISLRLKPGDQTLAGVTVTAKRNEKVWQRQLQQFKTQLFGDPFGSQCVLLNPDVLQFKEDNGHLKAVATEPLRIQNQALGYQLWFDLTYFDGQTRQVYYSGSARFEEIDQKNKRQEKRFQRNRMRAYLGSTRHLMTSLIAGDYQQQHFLVYEELDSTLSTDKANASVTLKQAIDQKLRPIRQPDLIQPGQLPFERMLVLNKPLIVLYTKALSPYSPYRDAPYAYTRIKLPTGSMQMHTNGWITVPNGVQMQGALAQDRLSTLLPADWQPTPSDAVITPNGNDLIQAIPTTKIASYAEKAYLHTDRVHYVAGDTLWFKAYVVEATEHKSGALSQTLYVNLVDSTGTRQVSQRLRLDSTGQAPGNITLPASLPSGTYQLLAYTNWMRNAGDEFLFRKRIRIESATAFPVATALTPSVGLTLRLFPEGGNLVEGLPARVAFQALDGQGRSLAIKGVVTNQKGDTLSDFQSLHRGMGTFTLTPQPGQHYRVLATSADGPILPVELPEALPTGYALAVDNLTNPQALRALIRNNQPEMGQLTLFAHMRGHICYQAQLDATKTDLLVAIPYDSIRQDGILHLTLFDADNHPVAERLAFINQHRALRIQIQPDKDTYRPRQAMTLNFLVSDASGQPIATKLSLAVTDTKQAVELEPGAATLRSYLLLTSDLRGHIEAPDYYFESMDDHVRQYLDYVMMTHGWRRFSWQALLSDSTARPSYGLETGLSIGGQVRYGDDKQPAREASLTGIIRTSQRLVPMDIRTDKEGRFSIGNLLFSDTATVIIRHLTNRSIRLSLEEQTVPDLVSLPSLSVRGVADQQARINQALETQAVARQRRERGGRLLQAVNVKARKVTDSRSDYRRIMYGTADATVVATDQMRSMPTVLRMIQGQVAGVTVFMNGDGSGSISIRNEPAAVMMDGALIDNTVLATINPNDVEAIDVLKNPATYAIFGVRARGGVINILTRRGGDGEAQPNQAISKIAGYTVSREFYSPQYANSTTDTTPADGRATLYWNPSLQTDAHGKATVTFYNTDKALTIQAVAEGISSDGLPGTGRVVYSVKK
ncbi:carboxypeptidase-like regulatory domain-containing protein [Spirosoma migulaei]